MTERIEPSGELLEVKALLDELMSLFAAGIHLPKLPAVSEEFTWVLRDKPGLGVHLRLLEKPGNRYVGPGFLNALAACLEAMGLPLKLETEPVGAIRILDSTMSALPSKEAVVKALDKHWAGTIAAREDIRKSLELLNNLLSTLYPTPAEDLRAQKVHWRFIGSVNRKYPELSVMKLYLNCVQHERSGDVRARMVISPDKSHDFALRVRSSIVEPNIPEDKKAAEIPAIEITKQGEGDEWRMYLVINGDTAAERNDVFEKVLKLRGQFDYTIDNLRPQGAKAGWLSSIARRLRSPRL